MKLHTSKPSICLSLATVATLALGSAVAQAHAPGTNPATAANPTAVGLARGGDPLAWAAREVSLRETGHLHAVGEPGTTIVEQGTATGTYNCSITVHLTLVSANSATATFTVRPHGGSVSGRGSARFEQKGADGYFGGTLAISGGTGSFAHASGTNIGISGVVNRETFDLTVHVHGQVRV